MWPRPLFWRRGGGRHAPGRSWRDLQPRPPRGHRAGSAMWPLGARRVTRTTVGARCGGLVVLLACPGNLLRSRALCGLPADVARAGRPWRDAGLAASPRASGAGPAARAQPARAWPRPPAAATRHGARSVASNALPEAAEGALRVLATAGNGLLQVLGFAAKAYGVMLLAVFLLQRKLLFLPGESVADPRAQGASKI